MKYEISANIEETDVIAEFLKDQEKIEDIGKFKKELEKYVEKKKQPETEVEKWIKVLDHLVSWANEGKNTREVRKHGYRDHS